MQGIRPSAPRNAQRSRWAFWLIVGVAALLCAALSHWQWGRYQERQAQNEALDAALDAPATEVGALLSPNAVGSPLAEGLEWRTVTATGVFDPSSQVAVRRRPLDGRNGFWIVAPLVSDHGVLLVNRGWAPVTGDAMAAPDIPPPPWGEVTVIGRLRSAEDQQESGPPPPGMAWAADPDEIIGSAAGPRYDAYIELTDSSPDSAAGLTQLPAPGHRGLNNLVYSVQWVLFGLVALFGAWWLTRQAAPESDGVRQSRNLAA